MYHTRVEAWCTGIPASESRRQWRDKFFQARNGYLEADAADLVTVLECR